MTKSESVSFQRSSEETLNQTTRDSYSYSIVLGKIPQSENSSSLSHRRLDVLVVTEEIGWVVLVLQRNQSLVIRSIGCLFDQSSQDLSRKRTGSERPHASRLAYGNSEMWSC